MIWLILAPFWLMFAGFCVLAVVAGWKLVSAPTGMGVVDRDF